MNIHRVFSQLRLPLGCLCLLAGSLFAGQACAQQVGQVAFQVGQAHIERQGKLIALVKGTGVIAGDRIITGADGHVHLRMVDHGFIAVRPASSFALQAYDYNTLNPAASQVKLKLETGVSRTVSGQAGEAARDRYRFNTPVAAIGLRGTDYVVQVQADLTRVSVQQGAVTVSLLDAGCSADSLGPCQGPLTRELRASTPHAYLEARANGGQPVIVPPGNGKEPNKVAPPHPEEGSAFNDRQFTSTLAAETLEPALPPPPLPIVWGRWSSVALPGTPTVVSQQTPERQVVFGNTLFGLLGPVTTPALPGGGVVALNYAQGEAYLRTSASGAADTLTPAVLGNGKLALDFDRRHFSTSLDAMVGGNTYALAAQGKIQFQGMLYSDPSKSNMTVSGVLADQANAAGYLFDTPLAANQTLLGATRWKR